jgi:hypothetical protein
MLVNIDRIQRRYGYNDEYILDMPFARFKELGRLTFELEAEEIKLQYKQHSLVAWKVSEQVKSLFANEETNFLTLQEFWDIHGYGDGSSIKPVAEEDKDVETAQEAIDRVQGIFGNLKPLEETHNE